MVVKTKRISYLDSFKNELNSLNYSEYTISYYLCIVSQFLTIAGTKDSYSKQDIFSFLQSLSKLTESSKRTYLRVIKSFLDSLGMAWPLKKKEIRGVSEIGGEALSEDEARKIIAYTKNNGDIEAYAIMRLLAATGMRRGEIGLLDKSNYTPPILKIILEKDEDFRVMRLDDETMAAINNYLATRSDTKEALFLSPIGQDRISGAAVGRIFNRVSKSTKIYRKGLGAHSMRRGWATWLAKRGMDIYSLQKAGHWKSISMPARYVRLIPGEAEEKARELNPLTN